MSQIKIHIVDDHQMLIDGLKLLLNDSTTFKIIDESLNGKIALEKLKQNLPDVLLTDISMPEMNGVELCKQAKEIFPELKVITLSMYGERSMISEMLQAGVDGYILKNKGKEELVAAVKKVYEGGMFFSDEVSAEMMKAVVPEKKNKEEEVHLTPREIEIVECISKEMSNSEISTALFISERTVETHRKNIFRKTKTKSVIGLVKFAFDRKLIS